MPPELLVVGLSHRTAPVEVREGVSFDADQARAALAATRVDGVLQEAMILSTCNRTELYSVVAQVEAALDYVRDLVCRFKGADFMGPGPERYVYRQREMASHLFRVATSLDSMILGEMQITGQVKDAFELARAGGTVGTLLNRLRTGALRAAKRARSETQIGEGAVSVASAAVALTRKVLGDLSDRRALVVGAGETGRLVARHLAEARPAALLIANRSGARAEALARELGAETRELGALSDAMGNIDVVVCATGSPDLLVTADMVRRAMHRRSGSRPLVIVDISVPRNVDPAVARIDNVFAYAIDALQTLVDQNLSRRRREVPRVESIVEDEVEKFFGWAKTAEVTPLVKALRERFESVRAEEVERHLRHFPEADHARVHALTRAIINKLLHHPTTRLKKLHLESDDGSLHLHTATELFALEPPVEPAPGPAGGEVRDDELPRGGPTNE